MTVASLLAEGVMENSEQYCELLLTLAIGA
jgi:hypothetical protein